MAKFYKYFNNLIDLKLSVHLLWCLTLSVSALKNAYLWQFGRLGSDEIYQFPLIEFLGYIPQNINIFLLALGIVSIFLIFSGNIIFQAIPFFLNGFLNLFFQLSDYLALHHDMLLSGVLFLLYGSYLISGKNYNKSFRLIISVTCATYLVSGIAKVDSNFLSGEIVSRIIDRSEHFNYFYFLDKFKDFSKILAWIAMLIEIIEPFIIIFTAGLIKVITIIFTFPFHMAILLTQTGTVYNLIYPASFLLIVSELENNFLSKNIFFLNLYKFITLIFISFSSIYIFLIISLSIKILKPL